MEAPIGGKIRLVPVPLQRLPGEWVNPFDYTPSGRHTLAEQLDVFGALGGQRIHAHGTDFRGIARILHFGKIGRSYPSVGGVGLYAESFQLDNPARFRAAQEQLARSGDLRGSMWVERRERDSPPSFSSAIKVEPGSPKPTFLFDHRWPVSGGRRPQSPDPNCWVFAGSTSLTDPTLIGIFVPTPLRSALLSWIQGWAPAHRSDSFGGRPPEAVFLSSAADVQVSRDYASSVEAA